MEEKKLIRKEIYRLRKESTDEQVTAWSKSITEKVIASDLFEQSEIVLIYADYNHEVVTSDIIAEALKRNKTVAVPRVEGKDMVFVLIDEKTELKPGYFGIPEPEEGELIDPKQGLMIMPGVAFDTECHRVGYGGGFYDRYLEKHPKLNRMALAFEFQMMPSVPWETTDIQPEFIVTENRILTLTKKN